MYLPLNQASFNDYLTSTEDLGDGVRKKAKESSISCQDYASLIRLSSTATSILWGTTATSPFDVSFNMAPAGGVHAGFSTNGCFCLYPAFSVVYSDTWTGNSPEHKTAFTLLLKSCG